jgi:hypothetical protein
MNDWVLIENGVSLHLTETASNVTFHWSLEKRTHGQLTNIRRLSSSASQFCHVEEFHLKAVLLSKFMWEILFRFSLASSWRLFFGASHSNWSPLCVQEVQSRLVFCPTTEFRSVCEHVSKFSEVVKLCFGHVWPSTPTTDLHRSSIARTSFFGSPIRFRSTCWHPTRWYW